MTCVEHANDGPQASDVLGGVQDASRRSRRTVIRHEEAAYVQIQRSFAPSLYLMAPIWWLAELFI